MLPWLTTVLTLVFLAFSASNSGDRVPGRVFGDDLVAVLGVAVAVLQVEAKLLFAVVDLRALDVAAVDLRHRHRRVDGLVTAGVVTEVEEGPAEQQHDRDRRERADDVFAVHQASACGRPGPSDTRSWKVQVTARPTIDGSRRLAEGTDGEARRLAEGTDGKARRLPPP